MHKMQLTIFRELHKYLDSQYIFVKNCICSSYIIAYTVLGLDPRSVKSRNPYGIQRVFIEAMTLHNVFYEITMHKHVFIVINSYLIKPNSCIRIKKYPLPMFPTPAVTR